MPTPTARLAAPLWLALAVAPGAACSLRSGVEPFRHEVELSLLRSEPADGSSGVRLGSAVKLYFSDHPDPATATTARFRLGSERGDEEVRVAVDLIDRAVVVRLAPGRELAPASAYTLVVAPEVTGLGGAALGEPRTVRFQTGSEPGGGPDPVPALNLKDHVQPILCGTPPPPPPYPLAEELEHRRTCTCATQRCHAEGQDLDLSSAAASAASLIDQPTPQAPESCGQPGCLLRVRSSAPAASYLVRKLLGTLDIQYGAMPRDGAALDPAALRLVSDWIAGGAATGL